MQNVEQMLAMKRLEMFTVEGVARNVLLADQMSWTALESVLGGDSVAAWVLQAIQHTYVQVEPDATRALLIDQADYFAFDRRQASGEPGVQFKAEFVRKPIEEGEQ